MTAKTTRSNSASTSTESSTKSTQRSGFTQSRPLIKEYEIINGGGILYMLNRSDVAIYDDEKGEVVNIRYCPNEPSIYKAEQSENSIVGSIVFENKRLLVPSSKPNLSDFLDKHPDNEANNGSVFRYIDYQKNAKETIESEYNLVDALSMVRTKPMDDLVSVAISLGINTDRLVDEVKHDLMIYAKKNPVKFMEMFDDPATKVKSDIKKAISYGVISSDRGYIRWKDTNNHIIAIPEGKDAVDVFTRYCLTEGGSPVYEELKRQLS